MAEEAVEEQDDEQSFVEEAEELLRIIEQVVASKGRTAASAYDRYKAILYKYQEQSQLLDAHLEGIVVPLANLLRQHAVQQSQPSSIHIVQDICRLLNVLVVVRGHKTVVKFFPHEAADLERVLHVLLTVKAQVTTTSEAGIASWEAQAMLLLWLSILILIPFELATVDSTATTGADRSQPYTTLVARVLELCKEYLNHPEQAPDPTGAVREMAALLLARLLTRPDMGRALDEYLLWSQTALDQADSLHAPFLVAGMLQATSHAFKLGQRQRLLPVAPRVWRHLTALLDSPHTKGSTLARKLAMKLCQRLGLTFLEPRLAPWRYMREDASLDSTLPGTPEVMPSEGVPGQPDEGDEEQEYEIAEEVEEVIEQLLTGLRDKDTIVRWSAAKGVGRVTGCLPRELGDEIVASVLELFKDSEGDTAWHGGCLATAELARRGLLLPDRLPVITPIIQKALHYDVRRGPHSIGSHVRDAAAYVWWAIARAYAPAVLQDCVQVLAASLLTAACYDREVNCRRAAAAAFQEAVGRLGNFPHGIDILTVADYFSVGNITQAYLKVAPYVSQFPEYRLSLVQHLLEVKLQHWEKPLRELSARALAALVPALPEFCAEDAVRVLLPRCLDSVLEVRHGAVVAIAELLPAVHAAGAQIPAELLEQVCNLVPAIDKARLYRGKGGEIMREAVNKLLVGSARVRLPWTVQQHAKALETLDENLRHPQQYIQSSAVTAAAEYAKAYLTTPQQIAAFQTRQVDQWCNRLHDPNVAVRRGYSLALGAMPTAVLQPVADQVIDALIDGSTPEEDPDDRDVESRENCVSALGSVCLTLFGPDQSDADWCIPNAEWLVEKVLPCLFTALQDYTTDNRGDAGSWIREPAMEALITVLRLMAARGSAEGALRSACTQAAGALLKQAVERIVRIRNAAMKQLSSLVSEPTLAQHVPAASSLAAGLPVEETDLSGTESLDALARLVKQALPVREYTLAVLEGLIASIGGVDASLSKAASTALLDAIAAAVAFVSAAAPAPVPAGQNLGVAKHEAHAGVSAGSEQSQSTATAVAADTTDSSINTHSSGSSGSGAGLLCAVAQSLLDIWRCHAKSSRMAAPLIRTADLLVTKTDILTVGLHTSADGMPSQAENASGSANSNASQSISNQTNNAGDSSVGDQIQQQVADLRLGSTDIPTSSPSHNTSTQTNSAAESTPTGPLTASTAPTTGTTTMAADGGSSSSSSSGGTFAAQLVELVRAETRQCTDVARLLDAASLLCHLTHAAGPCRMSALQGLLVLLVSKYPKVRRHTAEQLYLQLLTWDAQDDHHSDGSNLTPQAIDAASDLLLITTWDADAEAAKAARDELASLLNVPLPKMKAKAVSQDAGGGAGRRDEFASYQALIDDFARGY